MTSSRLPWFLRPIDRLVARHEHWATDMRGSGEFYEHLLRYASTRDDRARAWLAEALSRYDYARASRIAMSYLIVLLVFSPFVLLPLGLRGCGIALLLALAVPLLLRFDRWRRRRKAWSRLAEGEPLIFEKVEVKPPGAGARMFQSYWSMEGVDARVELDHPLELRNAVDEANEWWQFRMPMPHDTNGRLEWRLVHQDVGLVHRDASGRRRLLAGGVVYASYDPWTGRVET